jgi:hypothetical protein
MIKGLGTYNVIMGLVTMAVLLSVLITQVYAQTPTTTTTNNNTSMTNTITRAPPATVVVGDEEVLNGTYFHDYVLDQLEQAELISVQAFKSGMMILVFKQQDENERRMVIRTQSPITPEAGYRWDNGTIYTSEGRKLVFQLE